MDDVKIVGTFDVTEIVFLAFTLFFIVLVFYLRREDRREGYPLEDEVTGRVDTAAGPMHTGTAKTFQMPFGRDVVTVPNKGREKVDVAGKRTFRSPARRIIQPATRWSMGLGRLHGRSVPTFPISMPRVTTASFPSAPFQPSLFTRKTQTRAA